MAKKKPIALRKCLCGFPDMEIKQDKNGHPYAFCPDCTLQILTHGNESRVNALMAESRPVVQDEPPEETEAGEVTAEQLHEEKPARKGFGMFQVRG